MNLNIKKFEFWVNYVLTFVTLYCIAVTHSYSIIPLYVLFFCFAFHFQKYLDIHQLSLSNVFNWSFITGCALTMACNTISPLLKFLEMIVVIIGFNASLYFIFIMIENTPWYDNMKKEKEILLAQEHVGAEPDPKDFENSP